MAAFLFYQIFIIRLESENGRHCCNSKSEASSDQYLYLKIAFQIGTDNRPECHAKQSITDLIQNVHILLKMIRLVELGEEFLELR